MLEVCHVGDLGCWDARYLGCEKFWMWDIQDVRCLGDGILICKTPMKDLVYKSSTKSYKVPLYLSSQHPPRVYRKFLRIQIALSSIFFIFEIYSGKVGVLDRAYKFSKS